MDSLEPLLAKGEGETIEFKESFDEESLESIAAFANARGGTVLIGVADDATLKGAVKGPKGPKGDIPWTWRPMSVSPRCHDEAINRPVKWSGEVFGGLNRLVGMEIKRIRGVDRSYHI